LVSAKFRWRSLDSDRSDIDLMRMGPGTQPQDKNCQMLESWLNKLLEGASVRVKPQKVARIDDSTVQTVFPGNDFYSVSFATWPIAPRLPKELSHNTLVRIRDDTSVEPIRDADALRTFLARTLTNVRDEKQAAAAGVASLRLAEAVAKAGSFETPDVTVTREAGNIIATARATASEPAGGEVAVRLEFSSDGKIKPEAIQIDDRSRRGPPGGR
jgi:hypothetical protein